MRFAKWQGLGNDYIVVRQHELPVLPDGSQGLSDDQARALCDRNFGIGGDGILVLAPSDDADVRMLIHNPDGSMADMCGNGVRMVARYLHDEGEAAREMRIETSGGVVRPTVLVDGRVRVDMGVAHSDGVETIELADGETLEGRVVDVGNPHFVVRRNPASVQLAQVGPLVEHHALFPDRTNVEFVEVDAPDHVTMRVWERGVGETLACGSGACAVGFTAVRDWGCTSPVTVSLRGGDLEIAVDDDGRITMTGPAREIYRGDVDLDSLATRPSSNETQELATR